MRGPRGKTVIRGLNQAELFAGMRVAVREVSAFPELFFPGGICVPFSPPVPETHAHRGEVTLAGRIWRVGLSELKQRVKRLI